MGNRSLGNYDMVLGLSESKINHQFTSLYTHGKIKKEWNFLTSSENDKFKRVVQGEAEKYWETTKKYKKDLSETNKSIEEVDIKISSAIKKKEYEKLAKLDKEKDEYNAKVDEIQNLIKKEIHYNIQFMTNIKAPQIQILKDKPKSLLFIIRFEKDSKITYKNAEDGIIHNYILDKGTQYAFTVSIGNLKLNTNDIENNINHKTLKETLKKNEIHDNDFTIESLFLDFENSNILVYDKENTIFSKTGGEQSLILALNKYFDQIKNTDNPYVLGYAISKDIVKEGEKAMLYPTGVAYSTSFSNGKRESSFNFLMLLNNHKFPTEGDAGILPSSLLTYAEDKTATVNGVFGVNRDMFEENYVQKLSGILREEISNKLGEKCISKSPNGNFDSTIKFEWHNVNKGELFLNYSGITQGDNNDISINYDVKVSASLHKEIPVLPWGTAGADWQVSTEGRHHKTGYKGSVKVTLRAGSSGKLDLAVTYENFTIGFNKAEPTFKKEVDEVAVTFASVASEILSSLGVDLGIGDQFSGLDDLSTLGKALKIQDLENLENKVILPVASVYTYKNVRLNDSGTVILFDTSYTPVSK